MGRPKIEIDVEEVGRLARPGLSQARIAQALGISEDTLSRRKQDDPAVLQALQRNRAQGIADVAAALYDKAIEGDMRAIKFFLESCAGWAGGEPRPSHLQPFFEERRADAMQMDAFNRIAREHIRDSL